MGAAPSTPTTPAPTETADPNTSPSPNHAVLGSYHYGAKHHLDVFDTPSLAEQGQLLLKKYEWFVERREKGGVITSAEERGVHLNLMKEHFKKVKEIHARLEKVAAFEGEALYDPAKMLLNDDLSFEEWQQKELMYLIRRRERAMEIDIQRPDMNRTSYDSVFGHFSATGNLRTTFEGCPREPGHWGKRKFYYPVTDFSQLKHPAEITDEERLLEKALVDAKSNFQSQFLMVGGMHREPDWLTIFFFKGRGVDIFCCDT